MKKLCLVVMLAAATAVAGCAAKRPVLYPNAHLNTVGNDVAQRDIDDCINFARNAGADSDKSADIAKNTVGGAAIGAAVGAATGAVFGNVGRGAAAGAAAGGAGGLTRSAINSNEPDPVFRNFVERCLREKGYDPIGWR
jgi:hypothetical protein